MSQGFIKFLGTAGARFVLTKQLRASGGIWFSVGKTNLYIDPGPGALVRCLNSKPKLEPSALDGILLTHKHLDHSGDVNVMIEAMTEGGFKKGGVLFVPRDALEEDPVVLKYVRDYVKKVEILRGELRIPDRRNSVLHGQETPSSCRNLWDQFQDNTPNDFVDSGHQVLP